MVPINWLSNGPKLFNFERPYCLCPSSVVVVVDRRSSSSRRWSLVVGLRGLVSPLLVFIVLLSISHRSLLSPCLLIGRSSVIVTFLSHLLSSCRRSCRPLVFGLCHHQASLLRRVVGRWSSLPCRSVVGSSVVISRQSLSSCRRSIMVFVWRHLSVVSPHRCSSTSSSSVIHIVICRLSSSTVFVICRVVVWSLSLTVICGHLSEFVVYGHLLSVVIHCLWLSVVCGRPSSVVVRYLWLSVVCGCPSFVVVCHLWLSIACRSPLSIIVCCLLSLGNCTGITRGYPPLFK